MPDDSINSRLSRLEDDVAELRRDLRNDVKGLHDKVDSILAAVATMSRGQGIEDVRIRAEIDAVKARMCPKPGACVDLSDRMTKVETQYGTLHNMVEQWKGAYKAGRAFWIGVGAIASVSAFLLKDWFIRR
jgi:hypothetical protein